MYVQIRGFISIFTYKEDRIWPQAYLISKDEILFVDFLECEPLAGLFVLDQVHSPVRTCG